MNWIKIEDELPPAGEPFLACYTLGNRNSHKLYCVATANESRTVFTYLDGLIKTECLLAWSKFEEYKL